MFLSKATRRDGKRAPPGTGTMRHTSSERLGDAIAPVVRLAHRAQPRGDEASATAADTRLLVDAVHSVERFADDHQFECTFVSCLAEADEEDEEDAAATVASVDIYTLSCELSDTSAVGSPVRSAAEVSALLCQHLRSWAQTQCGVTRRQSARLVRDVSLVYNSRKSVYSLRIRIAPATANTPAKVPSAAAVDTRRVRKRRHVDDTSEQPARKRLRPHGGEQVAPADYADFYSGPNADLFIDAADESE